jgi:hypothetical protein
MCQIEIEYLKAENLQLKQQNQGLTQNELRTEHADLIKMRSALLDLYDKQEDELTELLEVVRKQEGYVLAPLEATDKMAMDALTKHRVPDRWISNVKRIYKAIIAASKEEKR